MKKLMLLLTLLISLTSCGVQWQYTSLSTAGHVDSIYRTSNVEVDTINSMSDLRWKLRNDFNFRYDFATYAMQQPYSWYWNNPRLEGIWRPYNRFDVYFYGSYFWNDWAFNYPFHHTWGWNSWHNWNRPYYYYGWNRRYNPWNNWNQGPWYNSGYNIVWNSSRRTNVSYINGYRSRLVTNNIQNTLNRSRRVRNTVNTANYNNKPVVINNNDRTIKLSTRTNWKPQSSSNGRGSWSRQVVPNKTVRPNQPSYVQPRQVRGGSGSSISQQPSSSQRSGGQRRRGGGRNR